MFRLVCYDEDVSRKADWIYLCKTASHTVAEVLRFTMSRKIRTKRIFCEYCASTFRRVSFKVLPLLWGWRMTQKQG